MLSLCKRYLPTYLESPAHQLTPSIYQPIYLDLIARGVATSSKQLSRYLSAIYTWAELPNPIGDLSKKTGNSIYSGNARDRRLESYQLNDFKNIMSQLTESQQLVIYTALVTGLRKSELLQISPESLHKATQSINISETKNGKAHRLPLPEKLYNLLEKQSVNYNNQHPLLVVSERLPKALTNLIPLSWHDLRRTTASTLASLGANEYVIKRVLNHTNKQDVTATHYARIDEEVVREWLNKLYDHFTS
jgi:integrase